MSLRVRLLLLAAGAIGVRLLIYAWIAIPFGGLEASICQYDCGWYVQIASAGYISGNDWGLGPVPNWAFFPLFPISVRALATTGLSAIVAGLVVANLLLIAFVLVSAEWLRRTRPTANSLLWAVFILLFPFGFIFSVPYTESLFMTLMVATLLALSDRRILLAGVLIAAMCATRPNGVVMLPLLLLACARRLRATWQPGLPLLEQASVLGDAVLPLAIAPLGLSAFMAFQYWTMGDALAFNHVQLLWDRTWTGPFVQLSHALGAWDWYRLVKISGPASESYNAVWSLFGLGVAGWLLWQRRFTECYLLVIGILLPLSTAIHSMPRFVATNPAFLFAMYDLARRVRHPAWQGALYGLFGLVQAALMVGWYQSANALF